MSATIDQQLDALGIPSSISPEDAINISQRTRIGMIQTITRPGLDQLDSKAIRLLNEVITGLGTDALRQKEINVESNTADAANAVAAEIRALRETYGNANPYSIENLPSRNTPVAELPEIEVVPGQTDIGDQVLDYNDYIQS